MMNFETRSRSFRAALVAAGMTATFLVVFVITYAAVNAVRPPKPANPMPAPAPPLPEMTEPNSENITIKTTPTESPPSKNEAEIISPTPSPIVTVESNSNTVTPTSTPMPIPTFPPTSSPTSAPTPIPKPAPITPTPSSTKTMQWMQIGESIYGEVKDYPLNWQSVSLSYDGNRVAVGNPRNDNFESNPGPATVKVFDFDGVNWGKVGSFSGRTEDGFGWSAVLSGNGKRLAIGSMYECGCYSGKAEIHEETQANKWNLSKAILGKPNDMLGRTLAMSEDGSKVAIGAPDSDANFINSGYVQIFELADDTREQKNQTISGEEAHLHFGRSVSMSADGKVVAIGIAWSDENGANSGSVKVFRYHVRYSMKRRSVQEIEKGKNETQQVTGEWIQVGQTILGDTKGDHFGSAVSINASGDTVVIGAHAPTSYSASAIGYVKVLRLKDNKWEQMGQTLKGESGSRFGESVPLAAYSNRIAIGSLLPKGEVKIFDYDQDNWVQTGNLVPLQYDTFFGITNSLSSNGNRIAVGCIYDNGTNKYGRAKVFEFN